METKILNLELWAKLNLEIKHEILKNLELSDISQEVSGELNEIAIKTRYGWETAFYGNGEVSITLDVDGLDYEFCYVIDRYFKTGFLVNF